MTERTETIEARSAMHARAQIVAKYGVDQHRTRIIVARIRPMVYVATWREATR